MEQSTQVSSGRRRSKQQIQDLLIEFEKSNSTVKDFCRQRSINTANFHKWKSRYKSIPVTRKKAVGFATLEVNDSLSTPQAVFAEVRGIRIFQPVSASFLKELLQ